MSASTTSISSSCRCTPTRSTSTNELSSTSATTQSNSSVPRNIQPLLRTTTTSMQSSSSQEINEPWHVKHILLPWDLREKTIDIFSPDIIRALGNIFPGTTRVWPGNDRAFLGFDVDALPSGPWPKTIGGLPIVVSSMHGPKISFLSLISLPFMVGGSKSNWISKDDDLFANPSNFTMATARTIATMIVSHILSQAPLVTVYEVVLTVEHFVYVFVDDELLMRRDSRCLIGKLAGYVGSIRIIYIRQSDRGHASALMQEARAITPCLRTRSVDTTAYDILRPGVVIASKTCDDLDPAIMSTCSGVLVENSQGHTYMTAASHGIGPSGELFLPSRPQTVIGTAAADISRTDISLVELVDGISFDNTPFRFNHPDATNVLTRLANEDDIRLNDNCFMETPYTGILDGFVSALSIPVEESQPCVGYAWLYFGQDEETGMPIKPPDSVCGSAIWNEEGIVYGFYRFYVSKGLAQGMSLAVNASELCKQGFSLARPGVSV